VEHVAEEHGRLAFSPEDAEPLGQFVRAALGGTVAEVSSKQ